MFGRKFKSCKEFLSIFALNLKTVDFSEQEDEKFLTDCSLLLKSKYCLEEYLKNFIPEIFCT